MSKKSRDKGSRGEREAAAFLTEHTGFQWVRGLPQTRRGGKESPDIEPANEQCFWNKFHFEVKRIASRVDLNAAMLQASSDARSRNKVPVVLWRADRNPWRITIRANDFIFYSVFAQLLVRDEIELDGFQEFDEFGSSLITLLADAWIGLVDVNRET